MSTRILVDCPNNWAFSIAIDEKKRNLIGASKECDVQLRDEFVSGRHAELFLAEDGLWTIRDLNSRNGILVEGKKVPEARLRGGETIRIGRSDIVFRPEKAAEKIAVETAFLDIKKYEKELRGAMDSARLGKPEQLHKFLGASFPPRDIAPIQAVDQDALWVAEQTAVILADVATAGGDRDRAYGTIVLRMRDMIGAENGFLMIADSELNRWVIRAWAGDPSGWTDAMKSHPVPLTVANKAFEQRQVVTNSVPGLPEDYTIANTSESMRLLDVTNYISVPILENGAPLGVFYFDTRGKVTDFAMRHVRLMERLATTVVQLERQG
jgi:hypothetical protein